MFVCSFLTCFSIFLSLFFLGKRVVYFVYEKVWQCDAYPPDGEVTFYDIKVEYDNIVVRKNGQGRVTSSFFFLFFCISFFLFSLSFVFLFISSHSILYSLSLPLFLFLSLLSLSLFPFLPLSLTFPKGEPDMVHFLCG